MYLLLKTVGGLFFNVTTREYYDSDDLAGITVFQNDTLVDPCGRPEHIRDPQWIPYSGEKITHLEIVEDFYVKDLTKYAVPLGIRLSFSEGRCLYILNVGIHAYNQENKLYQLYRGGESLTLFFSEETVKNHGLLVGNTFLIQEAF